MSDFMADHVDALKLKIKDLEAELEKEIALRMAVERQLVDLKPRTAQQVIADVQFTTHLPPPFVGGGTIL